VVRRGVLKSECGGGSCRLVGAVEGKCREVRKTMRRGGVMKNAWGVGKAMRSEVE
jgi:hypothetical protein